MFSRSQTELESMAKRASEAYLKNMEDLTSSVSKLAMEYDLSSEQIKRVCELTNHKVNDVLFKTSSSKLFNFKLADAGLVINNCQCDCSKEDYANDYSMAPKVAGRSVSTPTQFSITLNHGDKKIDKTASQRELTQRLNGYLNDAKHIKTAAIRKIAEIKEEMYSMINKMVDSGYKLEDLYMAAKTASDKTDTVKEVFSYIADRMKKEGKLDRALKIAVRKIATSEDLSGADGALGKYPVGDHWVKVVMSNNTMKTKFNLLDEAKNEAAKADTVSGHISDTLDMVKTIKK